MHLVSQGADCRTDSDAVDRPIQASRDEDLIASDGFLINFVRRTMPYSLKRFVGVSDLVQSIWLRVQDGRSRFQGDDVQYRGWVLCIARHRIVDALRRYRLTEKTRERPMNQPVNESCYAIESSEPEPVQMVMAHEQAMRVLEALAELPADLREIVTLRYSEKLTFHEISLRIGMPVTTCRRRWLQACEVIRDKLSDLL